MKVSVVIENGRAVEAFTSLSRAMENAINRRKDGRPATVQTVEVRD